MKCNAFSLGITSLILMTVSKNLALSQKIIEDWLRLELERCFTSFQIVLIEWTIFGPLP